MWQSLFFPVTFDTDEIHKHYCKGHSGPIQNEVQNRWCTELFTHLNEATVAVLENLTNPPNNNQFTKKNAALIIAGIENINSVSSFLYGYFSFFYEQYTEILADKGTRLDPCDIL